ncbi:hypothetical protein VTO42DRAFT_8767 [Malbranchea cinnamomea]
MSTSSDRGIELEFRATGYSRSTGKIEVAGKIIQDVLRKRLESMEDWDLDLPTSVKIVLLGVTGADISSLPPFLRQNYRLFHPLGTASTLHLTSPLPGLSSSMLNTF